MTTLPNLICPGAQKAGTSSLYSILRQHPKIGHGSGKEIQFFDKYFDKGIDWYSDNFKDTSEKKYIMDFTPGYMAEELYVRRMKETLGNEARFIFILRNPVDRMYSAYRMFRNLGLESRSDARDAFERDYKRYISGKEKTRYYEFSLYGRQIEPFLNYFPRENMIFILFEEFVKEPENTVRGILDFLGLEVVPEMKYDSWNNKASEPKKTLTARLLRKSIGLVPQFIRKGLPKKIKKVFTRNIMNTTVNKETGYKYEKDNELCREFIAKFMDDIKKMEEATGLDASIWKDKYK